LGFEAGVVLLGAVVLTASVFNGFAAVLCDDPELAFLIDFLTDLLAAERRFVPPFALAATEEWPPGFWPGDDLEDFLRDFVDIAFLSSLSADQPLGYCGSRPVRRNRTGGWASLTAPGYGYKKIDASPLARLMNVSP
jgi:hypothetical protein